MKNSKRLILKYLTGDPIAYDPHYAQLMYLQRMAIAEAAAQYYKEHPEEIDKVRHGEFTYLPLPDKSKWSSKKIIDSKTGKELLPGDYVLARNGVLVTEDSLDWLDWLAETEQILPGENLPEIHIEYNKKTGDTRKYTGSSWEDMNALKENADIATDSLWELIALLNSDANSLINLLVLKRQADRAANARTPGIGSLALLGVVGPMAAWDPLAFAASLGAAKVGEATLNYPFLKYGYSSFGDWLLGPDASETAKENVNLGTLLGGGFGYATARGLTNKFGLNLVSKPTLLADRLAALWAYENAERAAGQQFLNNYFARMPLSIEDVDAIELSTSPLRAANLRRPGVFYSKTGELNEGSVAGATLGHWQIKALIPGNALERKMASDGTISWKDFEWYLRQKPVEPYDKIHLQRAAEHFSKDKPIPYEELKRVSSDMIPKFTKTNSENLKGYGLDALGLGTKTDATEHYGFAHVVLPNEGVHPESIVFNNPIGEYTGQYTEGRVHFPHATLHMRGFTIDNEPGVYYYLEGQSDWGLLGLKHGDFIPGSVEEHMAETSLLRGIQEALLHAAETGNSVMRIPTPETVIKSLYWKTYLSPKGRELIGENSKLVNQQFEDFVTTNYPELNRLRQVAIEAEHKYNMASKAARDYIRKLRSKYIIPEYVVNSPEFYLHPEQYLKFSEGKQIAEDIRILRQAEADALVEYQSAVENSNVLLRQARRDPRALEIEEQGKLEELAIRDKYSTVDNTRQAIVNKYKAFPKHFRRLFGDKPEIRNITDSKGNTWFEVDVPKDINTRTLLFSKTGEVNKGSVLGSLQNAAKSLKTSVRDSMVKLGTNVLNEYHFWQNLGTDKNLIRNIYSGAVDKIPTTLRPKVQQGLDDAAIDELLKNTVGRRIAAFLKDEAAGLVPKSSTKIMKKGVDKARQALETVKVGLFPDLTFDLTELRVAKGFVNGPRTFVGYRDSLPLVEKFLTLVHEGDHIVDAIYPLSPTLLRVINEAFDQNFLELPKRLKYYKLWGYKSMLDEATTTATEARALLLNKYNIYDSTIEAQNKFISSLSDEEIFDIIENVNGYGRYYIDWLRRNKRLTPEKAELFRQAMIVCARVGETNKGSVSGLLSKVKNIKSEAINPISEENLSNVSLGEIELAILASLDNRNIAAAYRLNKLYLMKKFHLDHLFSFEPKIESNLSKVTPAANVTSENIGTLSPEQIDATYSHYAANKDYTSAEKFRNLYKEKFGKGEPITMNNKESVPDIIWDILYFKALAQNDLNEATRLRNLHFLAKTKNNLLYLDKALGPIRYYHSTDRDNAFSVFDLSKTGENYLLSLRFQRPAVFLTPHLPDRYWGNKSRAFFLNAERPATKVDPLEYGYTTENQSIIDKADSAIRYVRPVDATFAGSGPRILTTPHKPYWEIAMFEPNKIKIADPVTFDGKNVIPLSWRDNFNLNNVLFNKIGEVNAGSAVGAGRRPILRKNTRKNMKKI